MTAGPRSFPEISVVITAHDAGEMLFDLLADLEREGEFAAITVMDSGSTDGSIERLQREKPEIAIVRCPNNPGPCVTRNLGLEAARTEFVLWLDDDMRLCPGAVRELFETLNSYPALDAVGPRLLFADRPERVQYEGVRFHFSGLAHMRGHLAEDLPAPSREVDGLTSGMLLVRRTAARAIGGFEPSFFYLMEDIEFSLRLRMAGGRLAVVPSAKAWNAGGSAGLSLARNSYPAGRVYLHSRNRWLLIFGLYQPLSLFLWFWPLLVVELAYCGLALKAGHLGAYLRGKRDLMKLSREIVLARRRMRRLRRKPDGSLVGCPPLTVTEAAGKGRFFGVLHAVLDGTLRILWRPFAGLLP